MIADGDAEVPVPHLLLLLFCKFYVGQAGGDASVRSDISPDLCVIIIDLFMLSGRTG